MTMKNREKQAPASLAEKQREMLRQYYNDDLSLSEIGENFGITRQGAQLWQVEMGAYSPLPADLPAIHMGEGPLVDQPLTVEGKVWKVTCISVGNPHCVTVVEDVDSLKLEAIGPAFEHHANFPERINTEFVQVVDAAHLKMRVWERGSGETWACGTGTCATVAALTELGICPAGENVHVQLRGGELTIRKDDKPETVKDRLATYHAETEPLKGFYEARGILSSVENKGSIDATNAAVMEVLTK